MVNSALAGTAMRVHGANSVSAMSVVGDFRQGWQAVLERLQDREEAAASDGPQTNEVAGLVAAASSSRPATASQERNNRSASGANESSAQPARLSELTRMSQRDILHALPSGDLFLKSNANQASTKTGASSTTSHTQKLPGNIHRFAKIETTANSVKATTAMVPQFPLTHAVMPPQALPLKADKTSGQTPSAKPYDSRAKTVINGLNNALDRCEPVPTSSLEAERESDPSSAGSASHANARRTSSESDSEQLVFARPEKSAAMQSGPSMTSPPPVSSSSKGQSTPGLASTPPVENSHLPTAPQDTSFEQGKNTGAPSAALRMEDSRRDRSSIRETVASPFRSHVGISAIQVVATAPGTQTPGDVRAGQFAAAPEIVQVPVNRPAASVEAHPASVREPFMAIEAGTEGTAAKWVIAGAHRAEAGFQDSSLGWVSVRAQAGAGGIHAAVIPPSEMAAQVLGTHLAGLNAHMANQHERLGPVTMSTPELGSNRRDPGREMSQGDGAKNSEDGQQKQGTEDPQPVRAEPMMHSLRGLADDPHAGAPMKIFNAGSNRIDGHVSFVV